ncbi:1567_t:CDS:2, partial [Funneliformis mosseae]
MIKHKRVSPRLISIGTNANNINELYPIRVSLSIIIELNDVQFYLKIIEGNKNNACLPGYLCQANGKSNDIEEIISAALTNLYQQIFSTKTKFSGPCEFGLNNQSIILEHLLEGDGYESAGCGFMSSLSIKGKRKIFYEQKITESFCIIRVFKEFYEKEQTKKLATTIAKAIDNNKKGVNSKRGILSIIAEDYSLEQLKMLN